MPLAVRHPETIGQHHQQLLVLLRGVVRSAEDRGRWRNRKDAFVGVAVPWHRGGTHVGPSYTTENTSVDTPRQGRIQTKPPKQAFAWSWPPPRATNPLVHPTDHSLAAPPLSSHRFSTTRAHTSDLASGHGTGHERVEVALNTTMPHWRVAISCHCRSRIIDGLRSGMRPLPASAKAASWRSRARRAGASSRDSAARVAGGPSPPRSMCPASRGATLGRSCGRA